MILLLVLESLLLSLPLPMQTFYLLYNAGESARSSKLLHSVLGLWTVYFVLIRAWPERNFLRSAAPQRQRHTGVHEYDGTALKDAFLAGTSRALVC